MSTTLDRLSALEIQLPTEGKLAQILSRKRPWKPFPLQPVNANPITEKLGTHRTIQRCIALALELELPVGELALTGSEELAELEDMNLALRHNAKDEVTHYQAFQEAAKAYDVPYDIMDEVDGVSAPILDLDEHPVLLAGFFELTVFFPSLSIMRKWGSPDLKRLVQDVSRDESCHVNTNYFIADKLGLEWNDFYLANDFRCSLIGWLTQDLSGVSEMPAFWHKVSENLSETRQAPDLAPLTQVGMVPAFFENRRVY